MLAERQKPSNEKINDFRTTYQKDKCCVLHSFAFRRLGCKMQIYGNYNSDFHRTRLTHSLEVASIAKHIAINLRSQAEQDRHLNELLANPESEYYLADELIETLGLLHDIGHPPFGHGGEIALNCILNRYSNGQIGFEGNAQTIRIAKKLNLSRRTLLGLLKYPILYSKAVKTENDIDELKQLPEYDIKIRKYIPPKCYYDLEQPLIDWIFEPFNGKDKALFFEYQKASKNEHGESKYKSLDCSIMDLADDITYSMHDLEDAIFLRLLQAHDLGEFTYQGRTLEQYFNAVSWKTSYLKECGHFVTALFSKEGKKILSHLINEFVTSTSIKVVHDQFQDPLFKYNASLPQPMLDFIMALKEAIHCFVIFSQENQSIVYGGQVLVMKIFESMNANPCTLLSEKDRELYNEAPDENKKLRIISDYVAGMTDQYAQHLYQRLYGLNLRSIFERL